MWRLCVCDPTESTLNKLSFFMCVGKTFDIFLPVRWKFAQRHKAAERASPVKSPLPGTMNLPGEKYTNCGIENMFVSFKIVIERYLYND